MGCREKRPVDAPAGDGGDHAQGLVEVRFGRPPLAQPKEFPTVHQAWLKKEISAREAARRLSVTHKTFLRWAHEL